MYILLTADTQSEIVLAALSSLHDVGIECKAVLMDGHNTTQVTTKLLGFEMDTKKIVSTFKHPSDPSKSIHFPFCAHHLLKNMQGMEAVLGQIKSCLGMAEWKQSKQLAERGRFGSSK